MSDDPKSTVHPHEPQPSANSPHYSDPRQMDVSPDAYDGEEEARQAPEQQEASQAYHDGVESYDASHFTGAEDGQPYEEAPQPEGEESYETQESYDAGQSVGEEQPSGGPTPLTHGPALVAGMKSIAPRHTARPAQMRLASTEAPKDPDSQILALTYQLQELIAQKQAVMSDEAEDNKSRRPSFKPMAPPAALRNPALQLPTANPESPLAPPVTKPPSPPRPPSPGMDGAMRAVLGLLALCVLAGAFVGGRVTASIGVGAAKPRRDAGPYVPSASVAWSESTITQLDAILVADQAGEVDQAYRLTTDLRTAAKLPIPGLNAYLANFETRRGNYNEAESLLSTSFDQGVLSTNDQFGFSYARRREFLKASQWFAKEILENPFSAEGFYRLGETLRRQGNLQDAAKRLKEALVRIPAEPMFDQQREWTAFKLRLAMIEAGQNADLQPEIDSHLQDSPTSGYWAMTAAAAALQGGDELAAAVALGKAKGALPPEQFNGLLSDYFFRAYATRDQVAPFFKDDPAAVQRKQSSRTTYFIDP